MDKEIPLLYFAVFFFLIFTVSSNFVTISPPCSNGTCMVGDKCSTYTDCHAGLDCQACLPNPGVQLSCNRIQVNLPTSIVGGGLAFNKFSWLVTNDAFSNINGHYMSRFLNKYDSQEDNVTIQLGNGVRGMTLTMGEFQNDIWLCQTFGQPCTKDWVYVPALDTLREVEVFLRKNPTEIVTIMISDFVHARKGLSNLFEKAGLDKYWFPVSKMPKNGQDWPLVDEMVRQNHRLLVFTSNASKEATEGIAYRWRYIVENQSEDAGRLGAPCLKRDESMNLDSRNASLVMMSYFTIFDRLNKVCTINSIALADMIPTCIKSAGDRVPNFVAVDYYKRGIGGGVFDALDQLNAQSLCGCKTIADCKAGRKCKSPESSPQSENHCSNMVPSYLLFMALMGSLGLSI